MKVLMKVLWNYDHFWKAEGFGISVHRERMRRALESEGVEIIRDPSRRDFDIAVSIQSVIGYKPIEGKRNVMFATVESSPYPITWGPTNNLATAIFVPSAFCVPIVETVYSGPVFVVPEASDPELFPYVPRKMPEPGEPFRILHLASALSAKRKGTDALMRAFEFWFQSRRKPANASLYIKSDRSMKGPEAEFYSGAYFRQAGPEGEEEIPLMFQKSDRPQIGGVIVDRSEMSTTELSELWAASHLYVAPGREAWNLPLGDALQSGMPSIFLNWGGHTEFCDEEIAYPLDRFERVRTWYYYMPNKGLDYPHTYGVSPDPLDLMEQMDYIYHHYSEAIERGRKASERMSTVFTWRNAARKFIAACEQVMDLPLVPEPKPGKVTVHPGNALDLPETWCPGAPPPIDGAPRGEAARVVSE